jgi:hypothetical protein
MQVPRGEEISSYSFLTLALDGASGQRHAPAVFTPGKGSRCPLNRGLDGPQSWSGHYGKAVGPNRLIVEQFRKD